jgi:hypothetical protein
LPLTWRINNYEWVIKLTTAVLPVGKFKYLFHLDSFFPHPRWWKSHPQNWIKVIMRTKDTYCFMVAKPLILAANLWNQSIFCNFFT